MNDNGYEVAVFTEAIELPRLERAAFLDKACGKDEDPLHPTSECNESLLPMFIVRRHGVRGKAW